MSKILPRETIDVLRDLVDISLDNYGMDCVLYIPTTVSLDNVEKLDIYSEPSDYVFTSYSTKVFIVWNPSKYRLRKLGIFVEGEIPILAWLPNKAIALEGSDAGSSVNIDVVQHSYFEIQSEFIPANFKDVKEFEIVDVIVKGIHDAVVYKGFKIVPRRV